MASKDYPLKSVSFNRNDKRDMELYNRLTTLKHGDFSRKTKEMWEEYLRKEQ